MSAATVTEIPICACTGEQLEQMAAECFQTSQAVPIGFRCPCGHVFKVGLEKGEAPNE